MIYPYIQEIWGFFKFHEDKIVQMYMPSNDHSATWYRLDDLWKKYAADNPGFPSVKNPDAAQTLKAFANGLTTEDLENHNLLQVEEPDFESTTVYTKGLPLMIEKFFGRGTINMVKGMVDDIQENPEKAIELANWVVESWPAWKEKLQPHIKAYKDTAEDILETVGNAVAPIIDAPVKLMCGMSLREEVQEQRQFRNKFGEALEAFAENQKSKK